jgi:hypothetical protein
MWKISNFCRPCRNGCRDDPARCCLNTRRFVISRECKYKRHLLLFPSQLQGRVTTNRNTIMWSLPALGRDAKTSNTSSSTWMEKREISGDDIRMWHLRVFGQKRLIKDGMTYDAWSHSARMVLREFPSITSPLILRAVHTREEAAIGCAVVVLSNVMWGCHMCDMFGLVGTRHTCDYITWYVFLLGSVIHVMVSRLWLTSW